MSNILNACVSISKNPKIELLDYYQGRNRINNVGKALEIFIEDAFAGTINEFDEQTRLKKLYEVFSYSGNNNNPPDLILRGSDAIEVKKIQSDKGALSLNSSYPKAKLLADSTLLTKSCIECEGKNTKWSEKDIIYVIGHTSDKKLKSLWMVYGDCYAAENVIYKNLQNAISNGILDIPNKDFATTKELGKLMQVDPLGITDLRIRGMWIIQNPKKVFDYLYTSSDNFQFELVVIMKREKFLSFPKESIVEIENSDLLKVKDIKLKDPNNPVNLLDAKMITFIMEEK